MRKLIRYEDQFWFIDFSSTDWLVEEVTPDGVRHPALITGGYFMEILQNGPCIASPPENPSPEWFVNFFKTLEP